MGHEPELVLEVYDPVAADYAATHHDCNEYIEALQKDVETVKAEANNTAQDVIGMIMGMKKKLEDEQIEMKKKETNVELAFEQTAADLKPQTEADALASPADVRFDMEATIQTRDDDQVRRRH